MPTPRPRQRAAEPRPSVARRVVGRSVIASAQEPDDGDQRSAARAAIAGLYLLIVAFSLIQQPGRTTYDTRAELTQRPGSFLQEAFTLWHPESNFGEFQNQAYGYLFPQGPWFLLMDAIGVPAWVGQRVWSALVLIVAIEGARRVARAIDLSPSSALVAGLAYGFAPRLLGTVSVITAETLPGSVMPWALLPVVLALSGRMGTGRAALLSGAAVVCMGGVNAVENAGSLPLIATLVGWGVWRGALPRRFLAQWTAAVLAAALWWMLPLAVLAGYAPPFYEYVESAADTTGLIGWSEAARGDSHWVAYLITGDQPWWPAAHALVATPWLIVVSAAVTAIGLVGLTRLGTPLRRPLALGMLIGLAALTVAHGGPAGTPIADLMVHLLDGPLQIFRNVHKIDPTVRLPLALGVGQAVVLAAEWLSSRARTRPWTPWVPLVLGAIVLSLGQPYLANHTRTPGWSEISEPWQEARAYLREHAAAGERTLIVPGAGFAQQTWGWTLDEPLLVLGGVDRVTRSQIPLIPGQSIRYLDALNEVIVTGRATPALVEQLARAGVGHVVIRRDLLRSLTGSPYPGGAAVSAARGGLEQVAAFGEDREGGPEVEILGVPASVAGASGAARIAATPESQVTTVRGAPESVLALQRAGEIAVDVATVLEGEPGWVERADVVTDGDQRRERAFGTGDEALSAVMGPHDPWRLDRAVHDFPTVPGAAQVVARYQGLESVTASSSQGFADNFGPVAPQAAPGAAVDGDPQTRWITSLAGDPRRQWLRLEFAQPRPVGRVQVSPVVDDAQVLPIRRLEISAGDVVRRIQASPSGAMSTVTFDGSVVDHVEIRVVGVGAAGDRGRVGLREVSVDGESFPRSLVVPGELDPGGSIVLGTDPGRRACSVQWGVPDCDVARIRTGEEPGGMRRTVTTAASGRFDVSGLVVARSTREAGNLLDAVARRQVGATSVYGADPQVAARFAYDGEPSTSWVSAEEDPSPTLLFSWAKPRTITSIRIDAGADAPATAVVRAG
ncbi:alpha-(1-_3)-arabinofuranosyltransferase family protein, partial [Nocardioides sp. R-C-SC26]|uniref:alpha-(1->3)-arabinofuranosyltransferase domain-containing protein n=1 Tax=Nocardioides sp. R-C-SC26 TaxID=2870414 RepID=UPI001E4CE86C